MTQTLIGIDSTGVACVKITRDNLDPVTTPDNMGGAFLFNSKDATQLQVSKVDITYDSDPTATPPGTNSSNFQKWTYWATNNERRAYFYHPSFFPGIEYDVPLTDFVVKEPYSGWYIKGRQDYYDYSAQQQYTAVGYCRLHYPGARVGEAGWRINYEVNVNGDLGYQNGVSSYPKLLHFLNVLSNRGNVSLIPNTYSDVFVWNLPATNQPLPTPLPQVPGLDAIRLDSGLKIAKPGYDVKNATDAQLVLSSGKRATKIIAADDITIPVGSSEYILKVPVPDKSICDIQFYVGNEIYYPAPTYAAPVGARWRLLSDRIQFQNSGIACRARFLVVVNDNEVAQTVGTNNVLRQITVDGENVVQFLRPGASDDPSFSDIIIDSRWPALRILKEGYITVGSGAQVYSVDFDTEGYFPFIKMMVNTAGRTQLQAGAVLIERYGKNVRPASVAMSKYDGNNWFPTGDTTYAKVLPNKVEFYTFNGNPKYFYWQYSVSSGWRLDTVYPDAIEGIRYYIFGIPKKGTA